MVDNGYWPPSLLWAAVNSCNLEISVFYSDDKGGEIYFCVNKRELWIGGK